MKIVYFTTAQDEKDYRSFINIWKIPLNASNQNFHNKLIRSLAIENKVEVISVRPFSNSKTRVLSLKKETKSDGNITWHYISRWGGKIYRTLTINPQVKRILKGMDLSEAVFLTDTINTSVVNCSTKMAKVFKRPLVGICTDSPSNISGTNRSYTLHLLKAAESYNGVLALTDGLKDLFNPTNKPSYVFEGLVEDRKYEKYGENKKPYFFFGGALMERYGVYSLISAFNKLNRDDVELYICGHHGNKEKIKEAIGGNQNIKFLGLLPVNKVMEYEFNSLACINPRPFSEDLDRFSIPSKTLEYMSMGRPVISVKNTILKEKFPEDVIWIESSKDKDILSGLKQVLDMTEVERGNMGEKTKNRVLKLYSLESISKNVNPFLLKFINKDVVD